MAINGFEMLPTRNGVAATIDYPLAEAIPMPKVVVTPSRIVSTATPPSESSTKSATTLATLLSAAGAVEPAGVEAGADVVDPTPGSVDVVVPDEQPVKRITDSAAAASG